jgi:hypothetical protein
MKCETCKFCVKTVYTMAECHRNPPIGTKQVYPIEESSFNGESYLVQSCKEVSVWAPVELTDWCGEWKAKP